MPTNSFNSISAVLSTYPACFHVELQAWSCSAMAAAAVWVCDRHLPTCDLKPTSLGSPPLTVRFRFMLIRLCSRLALRHSSPSDSLSVLTQASAASGASASTTTVCPSDVSSHHTCTQLGPAASCYLSRTEFSSEYPFHHHRVHMC